MYATREVVKKLNISKDTLRYYEKEGLLPPIDRSPSGHRLYTESDIDWIYLIRCLRDTDMPIGKIKQYISLLKSGGDQSVPQRYGILFEHKEFLKEKIETYQNLLKLIEKKLNFYSEVLSAEMSETESCKDYATEWEHFRGILGGMKNE